MPELLLLAFVFLAAGVIAVPIASRLGLGSVLGYLLAGMALSPLLAWAKVDVISIQHFAEFGVVMMLFLVGLELEPARLWQMRGRLLGLGGGQVVLSALVLGAIALISGSPWQSALAIGMILALSSTAIILQTLHEKGLMKTPGGQNSFSVLLFQDIAVIPMLALLPLLALPELAAEASAHGADGADHGETFSIVAGMPGWAAALVTLAAIGLVVIIGNYLTRPIFRFIAMAGLRELFTATALLFVVGIALLMTLVGLSPALGTFIAGVVLANSEYRHELESDIDPFKGLLLGLFFMTVGAGINFGLLASAWQSTLFWTALLVTTKFAVLYALGSLFKMRGQDRWLLSLALAQAGEFGFVLLSYAVSNYVIARDTADQLLLVVAMSMLITPLLFILFDKVIVPRLQGRQQRKDDQIDEQDEIIIAGAGRVGGLVQRMLESAGLRATVIDYDSTQIELFRKLGFRVFFGDATRPDLLHSAGIAEAKVLVVAINERENIDRLVAYAAQNFPNLHIVARAYDRNHVYKLYSLGCRDIIRETYDSALRIGRSTFEAVGIGREQADEIKSAFDTMDRESMIALAELYDPDVPPSENHKMIEGARDLFAKWDPILKAQMSDIIGSDKTKRGKRKRD